MEQLVNTIRNNFELINNKIMRAASSCGRDSSNIKLVVVTKTRPVEVVEAAIHAGVKYLGENYPEEAAEKITALSGFYQVEWHMIGHLQSRKVKIVVEKFHMLHSLDSFSLAEKLNRSLIEHGRSMPVLLEFNVSGEATKSGWPGWDETMWDNFIPDIEKMIEMPGLKIQGLMTMPPLFLDPTQTRPYFRQLRALQNFLYKKFPSLGWEQLSMGTSSDFETAIQEGATIVRIGQAILGSRPQKGA